MGREGKEHTAPRHALRGEDGFLRACLRSSLNPDAVTPNRCGCASPSRMPYPSYLSNCWADKPHLLFKPATCTMNLCIGLPTQDTSRKGL